MESFCHQSGICCRLGFLIFFNLYIRIKTINRVISTLQPYKFYLNKKFIPKFNYIPLMFNSTQQSPKKTRKNTKIKQNNLVCLEQTIVLPSNLLQQRKNILQQFRMLKTSQNSKSQTQRQRFAAMSRTFSNPRDSGKGNQDKFQVLVEQRMVSSKQNKIKVEKNPLYKRICNIQAQNKQLAGVSYSKLLSRMIVIQNQQKSQIGSSNQYSKKRSHSIQKKLKSIPNYQCLQSKLFKIQCPQNRYQKQRYLQKNKSNSYAFNIAEPVSNRIFKRYFNPHGQNSGPVKSYQTVQFDQRYIYRNGKKAECKRIHNFYTSNMFRKSYQKHMRNTIDGFEYSAKPTKY